MSDAETSQPQEDLTAAVGSTDESQASAPVETPNVGSASNEAPSNEDTLVIEEDSESDEPEAGPSNTVECLQAVMQIPISVDVVLGRKQMTVSELTALSKGSLIALDRTIGEPVDLVVNGKPIARGKIVVMEDGTSRFGLTLETIVETSP